MTHDDMLRQVQGWPLSLRDAFEERAGIIEVACGVSREQAEKEAYEFYKHRAPLKTQGKLEL